MPWGVAGITDHRRPEVRGYTVLVEEDVRALTSPELRHRAVGQLDAGVVSRVVRPKSPVDAVL